MYAWIWRRLPLGLPGKFAGSLLLVTGVVALLWYVVFPWAEPLLPFDDVQVTQDSAVPPGAGPGAGEATPTLGEYDLPYSTEQNNPEPTATPTATRNR